VNIAFAFRYLPESHTEESRASATKPRTSAAAVRRVITHSAEPASRLIWIYAIAMGAFRGLTAIFALFLAKEYGVTEKTIGFFFMYLGAISVVTRALVLGRMVDWLGEVKLSRIGLVMLGFGLALMPLTRDYVSLALAVALIPLGTAFTFPCVTALLTSVISQRERGLYMGVQQTFGGAARVIAPIWAGFAWDHLGVGIPFWTSSLLVASALLLGLNMERYVHQPEPSPAPSPQAAAAD
jgi:MFS family permease